MKILKYAIIYFFNLIKHMNKKVHIPMLEVWVGQTCTLKCKDCCHLIPYVTPGFYDINKLIKDCESIFSAAEVDFFSIVGGEPFTNKKLYILLKYILECDSIKNGKIVTNGTIIPDEKTMDLLKRLSNKIEVRIDSYPHNKEKAYMFYEVMKKNNVKCNITDYSEWKWKSLGNEKEEEHSVLHTKKIFRHCWNSKCYTLADSIFTCCPRGITSKMVYGVKNNRFENIRISSNSVFFRALLATATDRFIYKEYCKFCKGMIEENTEELIPGKQIGE